MRRRVTSTRTSLIPILFYGIPVLAMGVVASVFPDISVSFTSENTCLFNSIYKAVCFSWVALASIMLCYLSW